MMVRILLLVKITNHLWKQPKTCAKNPPSLLAILNPTISVREITKDGVDY